MKKPSKFPYQFKKFGRTGTIYHWAGKTPEWGTYFQFQGKKFKNTFSSFEAASEFLEKEFTSNPANSPTLHKLRHELQTYAELEKMLNEKCDGATLIEAAHFFASKWGTITKRTVQEVFEAFQAHNIREKVSKSSYDSYQKTCGRFCKTFGERIISTLKKDEIQSWIDGLTYVHDPTKAFENKSKNVYRISLLAMASYAQKELGALDSKERTEFHKTKERKAEKKEIKIYNADELSKLLNTAVKTNIDLIPTIVIGSFLGCRPSEVHGIGSGTIGEGGKMENQRSPLSWDMFNFSRGVLYIKDQKVNSKETRQIPLNDTAKAWLQPFMNCTGEIWKGGDYNAQFSSLKTKAGVESKIDGMRHSYATHRYMALGYDDKRLAKEMGNSPEKLHSNYINKDATEEDAKAFWAVLPPAGYAETIAKVISAQ